MTKTQPVDWIDKPLEGYVMNTFFTDQSLSEVMKLTNIIDAQYRDSVFCMPAESLHITLLDWIAPLVDYGGQNKSALYESIYTDYDNALNDILEQEEAFTATFDKIQVSPTTVFITGHDNGQFGRIRTKYLDTITLLPGTKRPPNIIHSSLARFTKELDLEQVEKFMADQSISIQQDVKEFRLAHTSREPMLEFEILKTYKLK